MEQFCRTALLVGEEGMKNISQSSVAVIGLGGVGSYTVEALARAGVGRLRLVDFDVVEASNINRQLPALISTIGRPKAQVMAQRVADINPLCKTEELVEFFDDNQRHILQGMDWVVDAVDTVTAKLAIITGCIEAGISVVSSMGAGNKLNPGLLRVSDISESHNCPLARVLRKELHKRGIHSGVPVVWSPEKPLVPLEKLTQASRRQLPGSFPPVPAVAGLLLASHILNQLLKKAPCQQI